MIVEIDQVLTAEQLASLYALLSQAKFVDGKLTAGPFAQAVKHNQQLDGTSEIAKTIRESVQEAIQGHALFRSLALPRVIRPCLISRYGPGMAYGWHVDNALMGSGQALQRSDLSLTLFLTDPEAYGGGELVLDTDEGERFLKLAAGAMVIYPSTYLHRVAEVTTGQRLAAVTWVQSLVRNGDQRQLLFELDTVRRSLFEKYGKTEEFDLLSKTHANLLRQWAEV
jgi:PKHD-type hydroxylase